MAEAGKDKHSNRLYACKCSCGVECVKAGWLLRRGEIKSCGCLKHEAPPNKTHGARNTPAFSVWNNMKTRCFNPKFRYFADYGGRGITVCERWLDFSNFLADMGQPPEGMTLERVDNDKDYAPGNCAWASRKQQANNRRSNRVITANGQAKTLAEWAAATGIGRSTIAFRIDSGWSAERALAPH